MHGPSTSSPSAWRPRRRTKKAWTNPAETYRLKASSVTPSPYHTCRVVLGSLIIHVSRWTAAQSGHFLALTFASCAPHKHQEATLDKLLDRYRIHLDLTMENPRVLGKRTRRNGGLEHTPMEDIAAPPKRSRPRRSERGNDGGSVTGPSTPKPRSGLLTPEPSVLTESQIAPTQATADVEAAHEETPDPKTIFPFMQLPAELRLHIYHMALVRPSPLNLHADRAAEPAPTTFAAETGRAMLFPPGTRASRTPRATTPPRREPVSPEDPVVPEILRLNKQIYKEARQLLYSENVFTLTLASGIYTLSTLHQRSRSLVKHVVLTIPSHHDILDGFADLVRLGLRYCWGLKSFKIILHASLPDDGRVGGATSVYANAFHILRWLPRGCSVMLEGCVSETVKKVVLEEGRLMSVLDEVSESSSFPGLVLLLTWNRRAT
jgi:hypothetical protein